MRTLTFTQVSESKANLEERKQSVLKNIAQLEGVTVTVDHPYETVARNPEVAINLKGHRQRFYIQKNRKSTWDDIYKAVNRVNAVAYDFIRIKPLNQS